MQLVVQDDRHAFLRLSDGRLLLLPIRSAAAGAGRRAALRELPRPEEDVVAVGSFGRGVVTAGLWEGTLRLRFLSRDGASMDLREAAAPAGVGSDALGRVLPLGETSSTRAAVLLLVGGRLLHWPGDGRPPTLLEEQVRAVARRVEAGCSWGCSFIADEPGPGRTVLGRLVVGLSEVVVERRHRQGPLRGWAWGPAPRHDASPWGGLALEEEAGEWVLLGGATECRVASECRLTVERHLRVLAVTRRFRKPEARALVVVDPDGLMGLLTAEGVKAPIRLSAAPELAAASPVAPWLVHVQARSVDLRELCPRWGHRLARWALPSL